MRENRGPATPPHHLAMNDTQLGRYHLTRVLGQGAMGIVYEARDPHLDRRVAVKTARTRDLPADEAANYERRFLTEARSSARLRHPSIVSVFDAGKDGDVTYLVMELVDGVNLKHCLNNGVRFTPAGAARLVWSVLNALEHAHSQRVIHRDVKPENVLLDLSGVARLTDFGIAKLLEADSDNGTQLAGLSIGTPRYMSPEQVRGLPVDTRTDLYSVGVLLYELLTASTPFDGATAMAVAAQILHEPTPVPSGRTPGVSPALDAVVAKALAKAPAERFQTADAFRQALVQAMGAHTLQPTDAVLGPEPALALVGADDAPFLRWLIAQASATPNADTTPPPPAPLSPAGEVTDPTGTLVAQREAAHQPEVDLAMQALLDPTTATVAVAPAVPPPAAAPGRPRKGWVWGAAALLVLGGLAWGLGSGGKSVPKEPVEEFLPASAGGRTQAPGEAGAHSPSVSDTPAPAESGTTAVSATPGAAEAPRVRREPKTRTPAPEAQAVTNPPTPTAQTPARPVPGAAPAEAPVAAVPAPKPLPPREPCVDLPFLERESCLWKQCSTTEFRRHPSCKRFNPDPSDALPP